LLLRACKSIAHPGSVEVYIIEDSTPAIRVHQSQEKLPLCH
jgi:hypothetical protein